MDWGNFILSTLVALVLAGLLVGLVRNRMTPIVAMLLVAILAIICRNIFDIRAFELSSWKGWFVVLAVFAAVIVWRAFGLAILVAMASFIIVLGGFVPAQAKSKQTPGSQPGATTTTQPPITDDWTLHYYYQDPGVPQGYFGLALEDCKPGTGDVQKCKADILGSLKHDPNILTAKMRDFHLLDDFFGTPEDQFYGQTPEQIEAKRQEAAKKLEDTDLRKQWYYKVETVYDSMSNLHLEEFSGPYHTEYVDQNGQIHQAEKTMNPADNYGMTGTLPDGSTHTDKADCHIQGVSPGPLPNVPNETPPPETPTTQPPHVTTTTAPPPTTTTVPVTTTTLKCFDANGNPVNRNADGTCGTPTSGPDQQTQPSDQGSTPGYDPGSAEQVNQDQPTNNNSNPQTAPNDSGSNTGCSTCGQQGTTVGPDGTTTGQGPGQEGGTNGTDQSTPAETQPTNTGMPPEPAAYTADASSGNLALLLIGGMVLIGLFTPLGRMRLQPQPRRRRR